MLAFLSISPGGLPNFTFFHSETLVLGLIVLLATRKGSCNLACSPDPETFGRLRDPRVTAFWTHWGHGEGEISLGGDNPEMLISLWDKHPNSNESRVEKAPERL